MASWLDPIGSVIGHAGSNVTPGGNVAHAALAFNAIMSYRDRTQVRTPMTMATLTIRNLDAAVKERLRVRAAEHGHSMEAEARRILQRALAREEGRSPGENFYDRIHARFAALGGVDLALPPRGPGREPPTFD